MTLTQAEVAIYSKIGQFTGVDADSLRIENQETADGKPFEPPTDKPWCFVSIQYAPSDVVAIGDKPCTRHYGVISVQCFTPKNTGTLAMSNLCDEWSKFLELFDADHLEVYKVNAPQQMQDDDFYGKLIRAEFRVN